MQAMTAFKDTQERKVGFCVFYLQQEGACGSLASERRTLGDKDFDFAVEFSTAGTFLATRGAKT